MAAPVGWGRERGLENMERSPGGPGPTMWMQATGAAA
jgi:hypothetical protein